LRFTDPHCYAPLTCRCRLRPAGRRLKAWATGSGMLQESLYTCLSTVSTITTTAMPMARATQSFIRPLPLPVSEREALHC